MKNVQWEVEVFDVVTGKNIVKEKFDSYPDAKNLHDECVDKHGDDFDCFVLFHTKVKK